MRNGSSVDRVETGRTDKEITVIAAVERTRDRTIEGSIIGNGKVRKRTCSRRREIGRIHARIHSWREERVRADTAGVVIGITSVR